MKDKINNFLIAEWFCIKQIFKTDFLCCFLFFLTTVMKYAIPLINVLLWKKILDKLTLVYQTKAIYNDLWIYLGIYFVIQLVSSIIVQVNSVIYKKIRRKASSDLDMTIMRKMAQIDTAFFDDPKNKDAVNAAQTSEGYIALNMPWAIDTIVRIITFISGLIIFLSYDWIVGVLYMATYIPGSIISYKHKTKVDKWSIDNIPETRKKNYYKSLLTERYAAKDLRLYNLADYFKEKYNNLWNKIRHEREKLFAKGSIVSFLASLFTYCGIVVIIILSVRSVLLGIMAIGTLALYIGLAQTTCNNFGSIIDDIACQIEIVIPRVICYINFLKYENKIRDDGDESVAGCPEIEFRDVCFKYPENKEYTLKNLSFKIGCGKKIALIGVNGVGKTTIIKLLLRFYEPQSGEILLDGKNIQNYPLNKVHKIFGVCFQDIIHYSLTLRENIAISDIDRKDDIDSVKAAAMASGADKIIIDLNNGIETDMTRRFNDQGAELSDGQWQKIALARAFFRNSQVVILDEPTSALDPEAEDYIFSSFGRLCKDKSGILISHRLSGIMMVDEIVLLDNGTVLEVGTHAELMSKNGKYTEMYRMQAEKYRGFYVDE